MKRIIQAVTLATLLGCAPTKDIFFPGRIDVRDIELCKDQAKQYNDQAERFEEKCGVEPIRYPDHTCATTEERLRTMKHNYQANCPDSFRLPLDYTVKE